MAELSGTSAGISESSDITSSASGNSSSDSAATSLINRLRAPQPSQLTRKRKIDINHPPVGKKRGKGCTASHPKSVSPANEPLEVNNKKLFCSGCREELSVKKSSVELHIKSLKHVRGKERLAVKEKRQLDIVKSLKQYDNEVHPSGEMLPDSTRAHRVKVVTALLKAGVPLSKLNCLRDLLEESANALCDSSHLRRLVPFILKDEISKLKQDLVGRHVAIIFDGTTHVCEAFVVVLEEYKGIPAQVIPTQP